MSSLAINERRLIRASAGTGKTYQLTNRFISRLLHGVPSSQILAVTFTRNAAAEILNRILVRLARAASDPPGDRATRRGHRRHRSPTRPLSRGAR